jgi:hypothetical protein
MGSCWRIRSLRALRRCEVPVGCVGDGKVDCACAMFACVCLEKWLVAKSCARRPHRVEREL